MNSLLPKKRKIRKGIFALKTLACSAVVLKMAASRYLFLEEFFADDLTQQQLLQGPEDVAVVFSFEQMVKAGRKRSYRVLPVYQKASEVIFICHGRQ